MVNAQPLPTHKSPAPAVAAGFRLTAGYPPYNQMAAPMAYADGLLSKAGRCKSDKLLRCDTVGKRMPRVVIGVGQ